jgi:hypothetical protein
MKNKHRKQKLIKPALQLRLIVVFACVACASAVIQAIMLNRTVMQLFEQVPEEANALLGMWPDVLLNNVLLTFALVAPVTLGIGILATFRIAGPVFRLEQHLKQIAEGKDPGPCRLREGDELQDLCEHLNAALDALRASKGAGARDESRAA